MRIALASLAVLAFPLSAGASEWTFDSAHTSAQFAVKHMMVSTVRGAFSGVTGSVNYDDKDFSKSSVEVTIPVATVDTREPKRDGHLKSPDFFEAEKFPTMTFKSTKISKGPDGKVKVEGNLTIKGTTKPVVFDADVTPVMTTGGKSRIGLSATTKINRKDFGLVWNRPLEAGAGVLVGDEVSVTIDAELVPKA